MGKALTLIGMWMFINIVALVVGISAGAIDPNTELLLGNAVLGNDDMISPNINNYGSDTSSWGFNNTLSNSLPQASATEAGTTGTSFPDWINSSLKWISQVVGVLLNIVGMPYTFLVFMLGASALVSVIGIGLSLLNLFIIVNWIFGKVD